MRILDRLKAAPFVRKTIVRCSVLQRDPDIQRIDDIHIFAAELNIRRTVSCRCYNGGQICTIRRSAQSARSVTKAAVTDEGERRVRLPIQCRVNKIRDIVLVFTTAVGDGVIEQHRIDAAGFITRLNGSTRRVVIAELQLRLVGVCSVIEEFILVLQIGK